MILRLICLTVLATICRPSDGQLSEGKKYYKDTPLLMKPRKNSTFFEIFTGTAQNVAWFTEAFLKQLISASNNKKYPNDPFYVNPPQTDYNASELISFMGYPVEEHTVRTSDGYLLGVQRIPKKGAPVVLILHGLLGNSRSFLINYHPYQNLPTILSDEGFDVWLLNNRGAPNSMRHVNLTTRDARFWAFSANEESLIDLPETIDYILGQTGVQALSICGHSLGTTTPFSLLSTTSDYDSKVKILLAMAPGAKVTNHAIAVKHLYQFANMFSVITASLGTEGQFIPGIDVTNTIASKVCKISAINVALCQTIAALFVSLGPRNVNVTLLPVIFHQFPTYTSVYVINQLGQQIRDDRFQSYDFDKNNIKVYNQTEPIEFKVENIGVPVALFSSLSDPLATQIDIEYLRKNLKHLVEDLVIGKDEEFSHFDFEFGLNAHTLVYPTIVQLLKMYQ